MRSDWLAKTLRRIGAGEDYRVVLIRAGLALVHLIRHNDYLRGVVDLKHHAWTHGAVFGAASLPQATPWLRAPLWPGADYLLSYVGWLVDLRTAFALLLLVGVFPSVNALFLALTSFGLLAADRFHYAHHLWVLYVSLVAFGLGGHRWKFGTREFQLPDKLMLTRAHVAVVYAAAGLAKLNSAWLSGHELQAFWDIGMMTGTPVATLTTWLGWPGLSGLIALGELSLPILLLFPRTRLLGVLLAFTLHLGIHLSIDVSTFGVTMVVLLFAFLPQAKDSESRDAPPGRAAQWLVAFALAALSPLGAGLIHTRVGSYRMFTALVSYELTLSADGAPLSRHILLPHLGRDASRTVRLANGRGIGETNAELLAGALPALTELTCRIVPHAKVVQVGLKLHEIAGGPPKSFASESRCAGAVGSVAKCSDRL